MPDDEYKNSLMDLKRFFAVPGRPVSNVEFTDFWKSLTDEEKEELRNTELE